MLKTLRAAIVVAAYGTIGYMLWKKLRPAEAVPASPYPSAGARPSPMPKDPVGPVEPALIGGGAEAPTNHAAADPKPAAMANPPKSDGPADKAKAKAKPEDKIDLSAPFPTGDVDQAG